MASVGHMIGRVNRENFTQICGGVNPAKKYGACEKFFCKICLPRGAGVRIFCVLPDAPAGINQFDCNLTVMTIKFLVEREEGRTVTDLGNFKTRAGQQIQLRFIDRKDAALLVDFFNHLSYESRRLRFHLYTAKITQDRIWDEARKLSDLNPQLQVAIVATVIGPDSNEQAVGVARLARAAPAATEAEVAVVVRDDFQRKGLGKHLLFKLAEQARKRGITHFTAWVLADNVRLMKLIRGLEIKGLEKDTRYGETHIRAPID